MQRGSRDLEGRSQLRQEQCCHAGILVADVRAGQIAVRFLAAKQKVLRADAVNLLANPFEADLQGIGDRCPIGLRQTPHHAGGDQRCHDPVGGMQSIVLLPGGEHPIDQEHRQLIAGERLPRAARLAGEGSRGPQPIAVGIAGENEVVPERCGFGDRPVEHGGVFRIGDMPGHIRKIAVGCFLRAVEPQTLEAGAVQNWHHGARPHAMQRGIEDGDVAGARGGLEQHGCDERRIDFRLDKPHTPILHSRGEALAMDGVDSHHAVDDALVVRWQDLHPAGPVDLDGIVAGRIVAGGHHDAAAGAGVADGKRQFRCAAEPAQEEDPEACRQKHLRAQRGEVFRLVAGVIGDGAGGNVASRQHAAHVISQSLRAFADRAVVDCV